ncbi:MAG: hypothetical protein HYR50_06130 [Candidatus Rokubacteria bacterium]|nr:hypothetical protein [Candidatus Rokubacteria bacterium]
MASVSPPAGSSRRWCFLWADRAEAHYLTTLQQHRIIPHSAKVKGSTVTPSHYLNNRLDIVWPAE